MFLRQAGVPVSSGAGGVLWSSVFLVFLHDLVGPGEQDGRGQKRHVDEDLPLQMFGFSLATSTKPFNK
jgi:hypothetical protein